MRQATANGSIRAGGFTYLCLIQGVYYLLTGLWPLVSIETLQIVTGPKTDHLITGRESDHWLVMTVAVLIVAIGATLLFTAWRRREPVEVAVLAIASALALTGIDVVYAARGTIRPIYLFDAVAEIVLSAAWMVALVRPVYPLHRTVVQPGQDRRPPS